MRIRTLLALLLVLLCAVQIVESRSRHRRMKLNLEKVFACPKEDEETIEKKMEVLTPQFAEAGFELGKLLGGQGKRGMVFEATVSDEEAFNDDSARQDLGLGALDVFIFKIAHPSTYEDILHEVDAQKVLSDHFGEWNTHFVRVVPLKYQWTDQCELQALIMQRQMCGDKLAHKLTDLEDDFSDASSRVEIGRQMIEIVRAYKDVLSHCDLNPGNFLIAGTPDQPHALLIDFGQMRAYGEVSDGKEPFVACDVSIGTIPSRYRDMTSLGALLEEVLKLPAVEPRTAQQLLGDSSARIKKLLESLADQKQSDQQSGGQLMRYTIQWQDDMLDQYAKIFAKLHTDLELLDD